MNDDTSAAGIEQLRQQFQQFCRTQPNEGGRLSLAKSKWGEVEHFLRVNADVHRERLMNDLTQTGEQPA